MSEVENGTEPRQEDSGVGEIPGKPGRQRRPTTGDVIKAKANRLKEHAHWVALLGGLLPAVTAGVISVITAYRGEPEANRAYEILAPQLNRQRTAIQIALGKLAKMEGRLEGEAAARLEAKVDKLTEENRKLKDQLMGPPQSVKKTSPATPAPPEHTAVKCPDGQVAGSDGKCHNVRRTIAARVKADTEKAKTFERKLREKQEWLRREREKRQQLEQKVRMLNAAQKAVVAPQLKMVPSSLKK